MESCGEQAWPRLAHPRGMRATVSNPEVSSTGRARARSGAPDHGVFRRLKEWHLPRTVLGGA